jgi:hypothetical protein
MSTLWCPSDGTDASLVAVGVCPLLCSECSALPVCLAQYFSCQQQHHSWRCQRVSWTPGGRRGTSQPMTCFAVGLTGNESATVSGSAPPHWQLSEMLCCCGACCSSWTRTAAHGRVGSAAVSTAATSTSCGWQLVVARSAVLRLPHLCTYTGRASCLWLFVVCIGYIAGAERLLLL